MEPHELVAGGITTTVMIAPGKIASFASRHKLTARRAVGAEVLS